MVQNYNNLFVIIKNAILKKQNYVFIFYSKISLNIIKILKKHKFIRYYSIIVFKNKKNIKVYLKYSILGTESVQSIKKVAKTISKSLPNVKLEIPKKDIINFKFGKDPKYQIFKAKNYNREFKKYPQVAIQEGIQRLVDWNLITLGK